MTAASAFGHLAIPTKEVLALGKEARIQFLKKEWWIPYDAARSIEADLQNILHGPRIARAECRMIVSASNNGKSALAARIHRKNPARYDEASGTTSIPVIYIPVLADPSPEGLHSEILRLVQVPGRPSDKLKQIRTRSYYQIESLDVRMLILDEFNVIKSLPAAKLREFLTELRTLSVHERLSIVLFTSKEGLTATQFDAGFQTRFVPRALPSWQIGLDWMKFVAKYEGYLPLPEPSELSAGGFSEILNEEAEGNLGELKLLLIELARHAIQNDKPRITPNMIADVSWVRPSLRALQMASIGN